MAVDHRHGETRDCDWLAPPGLPPVLAVENSTGKAGATRSAQGNSIFDSYNEQRESSLGRTTDSRGIAQAGYRRRRDEREQVHDPSPPSALADVADLS